MTQLTESERCDHVILPFLKWAGGKRWLTVSYGQLLRGVRFRRYIEPFLGSGAVFFHLMPDRALLSDVNADLVSAYNAVKSRRIQLEFMLRQHHALHSEGHYYKIRSGRPEGALERAARLIYLNRTCWNGLYRVNRKGEFNVPIGTKTRVFSENESLLGQARALRSADVRVQDFEKTINLAGEGDFVFVDPPYTVKHNHNGFLKYNERIFSWADQERLAVVLRRAADRGALVLMTNADHESVRALYGEFFQLSVKRSSVLAGSAAARGGTEELLVANFPLES